jgi:enamine deaminase RidA (YjgF/YER057c/UK114 family)
MKITRAVTRTPWEEALGYARATRAGDLVLVSSTAAAGPDGQPLAPDAYGQAHAIFGILEDVLQRLGSRLDQVMRLRVYYVDPGIAEGFATALHQAFPQGAPALSAIRVAGLFDSRFLLEIEADAVVAEWKAEARERDDSDEPVD